MACTPASAAYVLQTAINRFANDPNFGFDPISVDCNIGVLTAGAATYALDSIGSISDGTGGINDILAASAQGYTANLNTPADIAADAANIAQLINSGADILGFQNIPAPVVASSAQIVPHNARPLSPAGQAALDRIKKANSFLGLGLPSWMTYAGGAAVAIGALMMIAKRTKNRGRRR